MSSAPLSPGTIKRLADFTKSFQGFSGAATNSLTNSILSKGGEMEKVGPSFSPKSPKYSPPTTPRKNDDDDPSSRPYDPCSPACSYGNRTPPPINFETHYSPTLHNYSVPPVPLQSLSSGGGYPSMYPAGSASYPAGGASYPAGGASYPAGGASYPAGNASYPAGGASYPAGNASYPAGNASYTAGTSLYTGGYQFDSSGYLGSSGGGGGGYTNTSSFQPPSQQSLKNSADNKYGPPLTQPVTTQVPPQYQSSQSQQPQRGLRMTHDSSNSYQQKNEKKFNQPLPPQPTEDGRKSVKRSYDDRRAEGGESYTRDRKYDGGGGDRKYDGGGNRHYDDRKRYDERGGGGDYRDSRGSRRDGDDRYSQKRKYDDNETRRGESKRNDRNDYSSRGAGGGTGGGTDESRGQTATGTSFLTESSLATNTIILDLQKKIKILERDMTSVLRRQEEMHLNIQNNNNLKR